MLTLVIGAIALALVNCAAMLICSWGSVMLNTLKSAVLFFLRKFSLLIALVSLFSLVACGRAAPEIKLEKIQGYAQGTTYHISFWAESAPDLLQIHSDLNKTLAQIDEELSTYRDDSYISRFNQSQSTDWQAASEDFIQLLEIAKDINQKTMGCYDPTIGPLFQLWGFKKDSLHVPGQEQIDSVLAVIGLDKLEVDRAAGRIRKTLPGLQLDLSSMGEGYTIGKLSQVLEGQGISNYLVEFGGDMKIRGHKPNGDKWRLAIERPVHDNDQPTPYQLVRIDDESGVTLDTSGTYHHYFDDNGKEYSHILNPRTGAPVSHKLVSASVFGTDPRVSDAWATAMLCLGDEVGAQVAQQQNLEVFFIRNEQGQLFNSESEALTASKRLLLEKP